MDGAPHIPGLAPEHQIYPNNCRWQCNGTERMIMNVTIIKDREKNRPASR